MAMNGKSEESLDQWVRQSLDRLPDAPPPGSAFDPERVWGKARPQLSAKPVSRQRTLITWIAAGCMAGLFIYMVWPRTQIQQSASAKSESGSTSGATNQRSTTYPQETRFAQKLSKPSHKQQITGSLHTTSLPIEDTVWVTQQPMPVEVGGPISAPLTVDVSIANVTAEISQPLTPTPSPKRRFKVVHENELRAEEETRPVLYRTDHFVRLGTADKQASDEGPRPAPVILPLTTKANR